MSSMFGGETWKRKIHIVFSGTEPVICLAIAEQYGKKSEVMETGYKTHSLGGAPLIFADLPYNETKQQNFIDSALPTIK